jgi:hypothetical protein
MFECSAVPRVRSTTEFSRGYIHTCFYFGVTHMHIMYTILVDWRVFDNPTALVSYYFRAGVRVLRFCVIIIYCALN